MAVEDSILDTDVSSLLVEQLVKRTRRNAEVANALSQPIGIHPAMGAIQSHVKGSVGDSVMVGGEFSPVSARSSGDATTAAALMIMEVESQVEQERAVADEQRAKATASRLALLKAQAEGSPSGGSRRGRSGVATLPQTNLPQPLQDGRRVPEVDVSRELSMMMDDELDAKVNQRQKLNEAALLEHQQKEQLARDQFLRRQMADEAALEKAAYTAAVSQRLALAEESANAEMALQSLKTEAEERL